MNKLDFKYSISKILLFVLLALGTSLSASVSRAAMMSEEMDDEYENAPVGGINSGELLLTGEVGSTQLLNRGKAVRCERASSGKNILKGSCRSAKAFDLNKTVRLDAGLYLLGFENSLYPGVVEILPGKLTSIAMKKIVIPMGVAEAQVYRDFTKQSEQRKHFFFLWSLGRDFFRQTDEYDFEEFYIPIWPLRASVPELSYEYCGLRGVSLNPEAERACRAWNSGNYLDLAGLFNFDRRGRFIQYEVGTPGDLFPHRNKRHLVSPPLKSGEFATVFPGNYVIEMKAPNGQVTAQEIGLLISDTPEINTESAPVAAPVTPVTPVPMATPVIPAAPVVSPSPARSLEEIADEIQPFRVRR